jgi:hypothetical protein
MTNTFNSKAETHTVLKLLGKNTAVNTPTVNRYLCRLRTARTAKELQNTLPERQKGPVVYNLVGVCPVNNA